MPWRIMQALTWLAHMRESINACSPLVARRGERASSARAEQLLGEDLRPMLYSAACST